MKNVYVHTIAKTVFIPGATYQPKIDGGKEQGQYMALKGICTTFVSILF